MNPETHEQWALERVDAYVDGELSAHDRTQFEAALANSDALRGELSLARRVQSALRALPKRDAPQYVMDAARREAVAATALPIRRHRPLWPWTTALAAAAAVLLMVAVLRDVNAPIAVPPAEGPPAVAVRPTSEATAAELAAAREELMMTFAYLGAVQRRGAAVAGTAVDASVAPAFRTAIDALNFQPELIQPPAEAGKELTS